MIENWQRIDKEHSQCSECGAPESNKLLQKGRCAPCFKIMEEQKTKALRKAEKRVVAKATKSAASLLAAMRDKGKTGASMPKVIDSFWQGIGGEEKFGDLMVGEFQKALGQGVYSEDEADIYGGDMAPKLRLQWFEMLSRHASKVDEGKQLDVGSLEESELETILADIARNAVLTDPELRRIALLTAMGEDSDFRRLAFQEAITREPKLAEELLEVNGVVTVDGVVTKLSEAPSNDSVEEPVAEQDDGSYDPTEDEYRP